MPDNPEEFDPRVIALLERLAETPERNAETAGRGKAQFLSEAQNLAAAVSAAPKRRHTDSKPKFFGKWRPKMTLVSSLLVLFALLTGGTGATVYAAQSSLPDDTLYPVKLLTEDVLVGLETDPDDQVDLELTFAETRLQEMLALYREAEGDNTAVVDRWEAHMQNAMRVAAQVGDTDMDRVMHQMLVHMNQMEHLLNLDDAEINAELDQVRERLEEYQHLSNNGLDNPAAFRTHVENGDFTADPVEVQSQEPRNPSVDAPGKSDTHRQEAEQRATERPQQQDKPEKTQAAPGQEKDKSQKNTPKPHDNGSSNSDNRGNSGEHGGGGGRK